MVLHTGHIVSKTSTKRTMTAMIKFYNWYGGKFRVVHIILALLPYNITAFYEPFMSSAAVTLNKWRTELEVINDLDPDIAFLFRLMADREKGKVLLEHLIQVEYSEAEFIRAKRAADNRYRYIKNEYRKAELIFILITQSFNATRTHFSRGNQKENITITTVFI